MNIVEFLWARLDEDEQRGNWWASDMYGRDGGPPRRMDGYRLLHEVESKRRIIEFLVKMSRRADEADRARGSGDASWIYRLLALPYADNPDYEEKWRP